MGAFWSTDLHTALTRAKPEALRTTVANLPISTRERLKSALMSESLRELGHTPRHTPLPVLAPNSESAARAPTRQWLQAQHARSNAQAQRARSNASTHRADHGGGRLADRFAGYRSELKTLEVQTDAVAAGRIAAASDVDVDAAAAADEGVPVCSHAWNADHGHECERWFHAKQLDLHVPRLATVDPSEAIVVKPAAAALDFGPIALFATCTKPDAYAAHIFTSTMALLRRHVPRLLLVVASCRPLPAAHAEQADVVLLAPCAAVRGYDAGLWQQAYVHALAQVRSPCMHADLHA